MTTSPTYSIVMPSYQQAAYLEEAVRSVLDQQGVSVELLVMDPGSTDGSRELLLSLRRKYDERLVLHFDPDQGQSEAVNRGLARARGHIFGWLNSDDRLRPGALAKVVAWLDSPRPRWVYGNAGMIDERGSPCANLIVSYKQWRGRRFSRTKLLTENFIPQMAVFWNRAMWEQAGELDTKRHLDMDYDLWLRFAQMAEPLVLRELLSDFRVHPEAKGSLQTSAQLEAAYETARRHAAALGWRGSFALAAHRFLGWRTRLLYMWMKP
jgi:glycosyltransferase involved in cell wall biosynthesis